MAATVELDLALRRTEGRGFLVEMRCTQPGSAAPVDLLGEALTVSFDRAWLDALALAPAGYGVALTHMLFVHQPLRQGFAQARAVAQSNGVPLRLRLHIAPELHDLRWEALRDPQDPQQSLAAGGQTLLSRFLSSSDWQPVRLRPPGGLRALALAAGPADITEYGLAPIDAAAELALAREAFGPLSPTLLGGETPATLGRLAQQLNEGYDIVYLLAHGRRMDEGETWLYFADENGQTAPVRGSELVTRIADLPRRPLLVILAACQSAGDGHGQALLAIGPQLVRAGVPAVLAMQGLISMESMRRFLPAFCAALQHDGQIDRAVAVARGLLRDRPDSWVPALFLRLTNGRLWEEEQPAAVVVAAELAAQAAVILPPPAIYVPEAASFLGRAEELRAMQQRLDQSGLLMITGMPGVGKTMLAATLARRVAPPDRIFWHSFTAGENLDALIWLLAGMLARHGQHGLWELIQQARQSGGQLPPAEVLLGYLAKTLVGQGYLLCLDDLHLIEDDPRVEQLIDRLRPELARGTLGLIITSRRVPPFARESDLAPLSGLTREDARALLELRGVLLDEMPLDVLHQQTGGNAQLLTLALDALQREQRPAKLLAALLETSDIERFLLREVDAGLSEGERSVMQALATLLDEGGTRTAIEALLDEGGLRRTLRGLADRSLLQTSESPDGTVFRQHAIVQAFYYGELSRRERQTLHRRAAAFFEADGEAPLRAAVHHERGNDVRRAAEIASVSARELFNQGQGSTLAALLERLSGQALDEQLWARVVLARGEILVLLQPGDTAQHCFQTVLERLECQPDTTERRRLAARACRGMGDLLEIQNPAEAREWLRRGLDLLGDVDRTEAGWLHLRLGAVLMLSGDDDGAAAALAQSLVLLPQEAHEPRGRVELNLGVLACQHGELVQGEHHFQRALAEFERGGIYWLEAGVCQNLGMIRMINGDWPGAAEMYSQGIVQARELGLIYDLLALQNNLGVLRICQGRLAEARVTLDDALASAIASGLRENQVHLLVNLADLELRCTHWGAAADLLARAGPLAEELELRGQIGEIAQLRVPLCLACGDLAGALEHAERAVAEARAQGDPLYEGKGLRAQGQALLAVGRAGEAQAVWAQSVQLLADEPYEQARTQALWGRSLLERDPGAGQALLEEARATFARLGASGELGQKGG
ncbi:MAG TPA: CHAT domain-containing protein [Roseiflexaceae bacterium]|nr:CHAT domain-containing protein [Roseiflexaceae bacterium]